MPVPQRLTFVTLGARSVPALREFYAAWGWTERPGGDESFVSYDVGSVRLALFPLSSLTAEAAPGSAPPAPGAWNGFTLAVNVSSAAEVESVFRAAVSAGASVIAEPVAREWGGTSAYVADPEGTRWELAHLPGSTF